MIDERDMPSLQPPRHELVALADEILADVQHYCGGTLSLHYVAMLRAGIIARMRYVRHEAARGWLGSALTRARSDD